MASGISLKRGVIVAVLVAPLLIWRGEAQDSKAPEAGKNAPEPPDAKTDAKTAADAPAVSTTPPAGAETLPATGGTPPGEMPMGGPGAPKAPPGSGPHHANSNFNSQAKAELQGQKSWDDLIRVLHKAAVIRGEIAAKAAKEKMGLNDEVGPTEKVEGDDEKKESTKEAGKGSDEKKESMSLIEAKKKKKQAKKKTKKKHKSGSHGGAHKEM